MSIPVDPAFRAVPKNSTFFFIWRIEKLQVIAVPREHFGHFYNGDSYIVACATEGRERGDSQLKPREVKGVPDIHIHFWLGSKTSQDEAGIAAYKTVELDDYLGGTPVQHRETQGHESQRFLSYFRSGMRVLEGGIASGFNKVDLSLKPSLFQVKGKRSPVIRELSNISWDQLNDGDVFILDACKYVFLWTGQFANNMEKIQAVKAAQQLKSEHSPECEAVVIVEDGNESQLKDEEREYFEKYLPLNSKCVKSHEEVPKDDLLEMKGRSELKLYRVSDEDGNLKVMEVKPGPLEQKDLNSKDSFIIDNNEAGIWVWVGKRASPNERTESMRNAQGFIKKKGYSEHTRVTRVIDGGEPVEFRNLFKSWKDSNQSNGFGATHNVGKIAKVIPEKFDPSVLHENHALAAETQMVDDGSGEKEIFRVKNFDLVPLPKEDYGKFYSGDCYLVIYTYDAGSVIIYYWLGLNSSTDERGTAAMKTVDFDNNKFSGRAVQVRVVEGKEPPHFMSLFNGRMVIYKGGFTSGFNNSTGEGTTEDRCLIQVRGTSQYNTKAIQVDCRASSLNSNDVFVLSTPDTVYIWAGKGSIGDEREMAKTIASQERGKEVLLVSEGQEKDDFWEAIGGKEDYSNDKRLQLCDDPHSPRLFQCSNARGNFTIEEIPYFDQSDLIEDDVMILDAWEALFIWIGNLSNADERKLAVEAAQEYIKTDPSGRDADTPIIIVKQGYEPIHFTGFFGAWNKSLWNRDNNCEDIKSELKGNTSNLKVLNANASNRSVDFETANKYPVEKLLIKDVVLLPEDVDPSKKEIYLTNNDFKELFGISYKEYQTLPKWKQIDLKKKVGIF